jgi:DNA helicase-2/ATP-dependent DNA helicase PcrA
MMSFIHLFEFAKGVGSAIAKEIFIALQKLGHGSLFNGLYHPDIDILNPFEERKKNHQLGLFDDFFELSSAARFANMNFEGKFLKNSVLRHPKLTRDGAEFLYNFYLLFKDLKKITKPLDVVKKIASSKLYETIKGTLAHKRAQLQDGSVDEKIKEDALTNIAKKSLLLQELARPYKEHERFLNAMILGSGDLTQGEGVHLLSIHASKGLEYQEVYVIDLMDGRFPNRKLMSRGGSLDEERRLFYVSVTRAKDILYLSFAKYDKVKKTNFVPSQFLYEAALIKPDEEYAKMIALSEKDED